MIDKPAHRIYRGITDQADGTNARILVMDSGTGPTERERASLLYELAPNEAYWWGHDGSSSGATASAILDDVLPEAVADWSFPELPLQLRNDLIMAFRQDLLACCHDPRGFWLPARTIVRWLHGFLREHAQS